MRKATILAVATAFMLATALAPVVSANTGSTRTEKEGYYVGGDVLALCHPFGLNVNIGGVCFDLKDNEHEIDIFIHDHGQSEAHSLDNEIDDTLEENGVPVNVANFGFTSGFYQIQDEAGNTLTSDVFCGSANDVQLPNGSASVRVFLDGALFGNSLLTVCGTTFSGATTGHVFLRAEDP